MATTSGCSAIGTPNADLVDYEPGYEPGREYRIPSPPKERNRVDIDDRFIVWQVYDGTRRRIRLYDLESGQGSFLSPSGELGSFPAISERYVTYLRARDIIVYDLFTRAGRAVTTSTTGKHWPNMYRRDRRTRVVWEEGPGGQNGDIFLYDSKDRSITQIAPRPAHQSSPHIYDNRIVWEERLPDTNPDIFMYEIDTGVETRLTNLPTPEYRPAIFEDMVVWIGEEEGEHHLFVYNISDGQTTRVTQHPGAWPDFPDIDGDRIVWQDKRDDHWDIYALNLADMEEVQITSESGDQKRPRISQKKIVWEDYRDGAMQIFFFELES